MIILRRIASKALLWFVVVSAALACWEVAAWSPNARLLADAAKPLPGVAPEQRGLTVEEVVERLNRMHPEYACPPDVVE
jgi:hypothetical protein